MTSDDTLIASLPGWMAPTYIGTDMQFDRQPPLDPDCGRPVMVVDP